MYFPFGKKYRHNDRMEQARPSLSCSMSYFSYFPRLIPVIGALPSACHPDIFLRGVRISFAQTAVAAAMRLWGFLGRLEFALMIYPLCFLG
jgi:hypothetical protein